MEEDTNSTAFVDRKETLLSMPPPPQMSAAQEGNISTEENQSQELKVSVQESVEESLPSTGIHTVTSSCGESVQAVSSVQSVEKIAFPVTEAGGSPSHSLSAVRGSAAEDLQSEQKSQAEHGATSQPASLEQGRGGSTGELFFPGELETRRPEEEKEVSEYSPGLAIRSLALEDFLDKSDAPSSSIASEDASERSSPRVTSQSTDSSSLSSSQPLSNSHSSSSSFQQHHHHDQAGRVVARKKKPLFDPIEVERKFTVQADTEERLRSLGAKLLKEKTFADVYYDDDRYSLILSDCWLRRRNDAWEAKLPLARDGGPAGGGNSALSASTQYREVEDERDISVWLVEKLKLEPWMRGDPVDLLVQAAGLTAFARFSTLRRSYQLPACRVDLDLTDHGFRVGEIEVMAGSPQDVPQALETIGAVAAQLGLTPLTLA